MILWFRDFECGTPFTAWKLSKYGAFSGPYFPDQKNAVFGHFLRSGYRKLTLCQVSFNQLMICLVIWYDQIIKGPSGFIYGCLRGLLAIRFAEVEV